MTTTTAMMTLNEVHAKIQANVPRKIDVADTQDIRFVHPAKVVDGGLNVPDMVVNGRQLPVMPDALSKLITFFGDFDPEEDRTRSAIKFFTSSFSTGKDYIYTPALETLNGFVKYRNEENKGYRVRCFDKGTYRTVRDAQGYTHTEWVQSNLQVRGIVTSSYTVMDNHQVFAQLVDELAKQGYTHVTNFKETPFGMNLRVVSDKQATVNKLVDDIVQAGLHVQNGEVGNSAVKILFLLFRLICLNGAVSSKVSDRFSRSHSSSDVNMSAFITKALDAMPQMFDSFVSAMLESHEETFKPEVARQLVEMISAKYGWDKKFNELLIENLPLQESSKFGLIQAVTHSAKQYSPDRRLELEGSAHALMTSTLPVIEVPKLFIPGNN